MKIIGAYIIECSDESYYVGSSKDIFRRFEEHNRGEGASYTRERMPLKLVYFEEFKRIDEAFEREHQIKSYSHEKKRALISNDKKGFKKASRGKDRPYNPKNK